jgi:hypothetical protein
MKVEFERDGHVVATVLWEGPGQVVLEAAEPSVREPIERFLASDVAYLGGLNWDDAGNEPEPVQTRRRDWTPWEFERACRNLAHTLGCELRRIPSGDVEARAEEGVRAR